jgi:DNA-binding transcriptional regulator LsrR (DeoR family)
MSDQLEALGAAYSRLSIEAETSRQALQVGIRQAARDGMSQAQIARIAGVTRMTVRKALEK